MGYNIKQKIEICLQSEANPQMTQNDLANWAQKEYGSSKPPSQTTISRILSSKTEILGSKDTDFSLVRRRKQTNPLLRKILTEWVTQALWEQIPITTPIIQLTANSIWNRLSVESKDGNGVFNHKWCNHFIKKLNINLEGSPEAIRQNLGQKLNRVWRLDEKLDLKHFINDMIRTHNYSPHDMFTIDEFQLFHGLPLDQIFDISSIDKGLKQSSSSSESMLTIMLGCNIDGSEKLTPLIVARHDKFDVTASSHASLKCHGGVLSGSALAHKMNEIYQMSYKSNNNKWITSSMFQDYLLTLDHKIDNTSPQRNILIFLDNSSSHRMINLEFKHIRLCYMENASKHRNPYNGSFNGVKFDYLPMSFGIVEEFKILYRLQQYLEMINRQRTRSGREVKSPISTLPLSLSSVPSSNMSDSSDVLSEKDYQVPFIKVLEWIKRSWDSISLEKIYLSWRQTYLMNFKNPWPASDPKVVEEAAKIFEPFKDVDSTYVPYKSYDKLQEIMKYLNVVIPWDIDELLGLVNERSKVSLNYVSIDEIIGSCVVGSKESQDEEDSDRVSVPPESTWYGEEDTPGPLPDPQFPALDTSKAAASPLEVPPKVGINLVNTPPPSNYNPMLSNHQLPFLRHSQSPSQFNGSRPLPFKQEGSYGDYAGGSPSTMNALLMATNMARPPENNQPNNQPSQHNPQVSIPQQTQQQQLPPQNQQQQFPSLPSYHKPEISLPPMSQMSIGGYPAIPALPEGKHRLPNNDLEPLHPDRKRQALGQGSYYMDGSLQNGLFFSNGLEQPEQLSSSYSRPQENRFPPVTQRLKDVPDDNPRERDLITLLNKVIAASNSDGIKLSDFAIEELKANLSKMQQQKEQ